MSGIRRSLHGLILVCAALAGCASNQYPGTPEDAPRMLGEGDAARPIELARGKRITLRLEANHSAGYRWSLAASGDAGLEQIGEPFYAAEKSAAGSGGAEYWTFRAVSSGKKELRFAYRRPWETDKPPARELSYSVSVGP